MWICLTNPGSLVIVLQVLLIVFFSLEAPQTSTNSLRLAISCLTDFSSIDAWICTAVMCNVVELVLDPFVVVDANLSTHFLLPQSLFMSKTLRVLKLKVGTNLICDPPASACLPSLRFLHLALNFPNKNSERLFSCCPLVEDRHNH